MLGPLRAVADWSPNFRRVAIAYGCVGIFFGVQLTLFNNFIVERLGVEAHELGMIEGLREIPGFLNFVFLWMMIALAPSRAAALSLALMGAGIAAFAGVDSVLSLTVFSVAWSIGFHAWIPLSQSMAILFCPADARGLALGQLRSTESIAWLATIGLCLVAYPLIGYEGLFILAGLACLVGGAVMLTVPPRKPTEVERSFLLRRRYWLYYALQFLQGCRKQMFITFAIFALVKVHQTSVQTIMVLVFVNQLLVSLTGPLMGRLVDRYGERLMLSISYFALIFVFLGYALSRHAPTLYVLYCLDNLFFFGSIALTTHISRTAEPHELKPTLSMGVTANHVASVAAPLVGGLAWTAFGYETIFLAGAGIAALSLLFARLLPKRERPSPR